MIQIDRIGRTNENENQSPFRLYLIDSDFYLDIHDQEFLIYTNDSSIHGFICFDQELRTQNNAEYS